MGGVRDLVTKALMGIKAYHSSPHDFDKFSTKHIGTGEGAQTYGHGIYFAENPAVSGQGGQYWQQLKNHRGFSPAEAQAAIELHQAGFDREAAKKLLSQRMKEDFAPFGMRGREEQQMYREHLDALELLHSGKPVGPRTYEVNIGADPAKMLAWDKPLGAHPEAVRESLLNTLEEGPFRRLPRNAMIEQSLERGIPNHTTGENYFRHLAERGSSQVSPLVSERMLMNDIPGIRYLDEGSRHIPQQIDMYRRQLDKPGWSGPMRDEIQANLAKIENNPITSNYVVFDPDSPLSKVDILKKYGVVGAPAGTAAMGSLYEPQLEEQR